MLTASRTATPLCRATRRVSPPGKLTASDLVGDPGIEPVTSSMRTLDGEVIGGHWGRSATGGSPPWLLAADGVAVLKCRTASGQAGGWRPLEAADNEIDPSSFRAVRSASQCRSFWVHLSLRTTARGNQLQPELQPRVECGFQAVPAGESLTGGPA